MFVVSYSIHKISLVQIFDDFGVRILYKYPFPWFNFLNELPFCIHQLNKRQIIFIPNPSVILTKSRCSMNYAGTLCQGNKIISYHIISLLIHFGKIKQRFVFHTYQLISGHSVKYLVLLFKHVRSQSLCQNIYLITAFCLDIGLFTIYSKGYVRGQGPWSSGPGHEVGLLFSFNPELNIY